MKRAVCRRSGAVMWFCCVLASWMPTAGAASGQSYSVFWRGVNLAGAEFGVDYDGTGELPGEFGVDYIYPNQGEVDYFQGKGMNVVRLPFRWERLQSELYGEFDPDELARLKIFVAETTAKGMLVLIDPHNYAGYYTGELQGRLGGAIPDDAFADLWTRLALEFKDDIRVIFGLMNEPVELPGESWVEAANAAIGAIRAVGATQTILVPGVGFTGAHSWFDDWYGTPNAETLLGVVDPLDNTLIEVHQYLDEDYSGTHDECLSAPAGSVALTDFTQWLRDHGRQAFLGEFGIAHNDNCLEALSDMLGYLEANAEVWRGWTYWAAGPWWGEEDSLEPIDGQDREPMVVLEAYLTPGPPPRCLGQPATIAAPGIVRGTQGPDVIVGSGGDDTIDGRGGADRICALGGADIVIAGMGADRVVLGSGDDRLDAGDGDDRAAGGSGDDTLLGGSGRDVVHGGTGSDLLHGGPGNDRCHGGADLDIDRADACEQIVNVP